MAQQGYGEANGKVILIGEHAVTFGEPAIAIPFTTGRVRALIESLNVLLILKVKFMMVN